MISTVILALGALSLLYYFFAKWRLQFWTRRGIPQLNPSLVFGDTAPLIVGGVSIKDYFLGVYQKAKSAGLKHVGIYNTLIPEYVLVDHNLIKRIVTKDFEYFAGHGLYHHKDDPLSMHLFSMEGEEWKERRVKLTPIFTTGKMKMMFDIVENKSTNLKDVVDRMVDANEPINIKDILARFTTDVIGSVAFGLDCDTLNNPDHNFREIGRKALEPNRLKLMIELLFPSGLLAKLGFRDQPQEVSSYFSKVVMDTINYRESNKVQRKDFMQCMLQLKNQGKVDGDEGGSTVVPSGVQGVTNQEIISEAFLFYVAGFETSSSTMTFTFYELAQHASIQQKLHEEIITVLKKHDGKITYDALQEMDYLDKVVKETLRKYPVVVDLPRICTKSYKLENSNSVIPKGTFVHIPVIGLHMDPEFYPNPEEFNPDNFNSENKAKRPEIAWIPFGEGPRQCIGLRFGLMQAKIGIVTLLRNFRFTLDSTMKVPLEAASGSFIYSFKNDLVLRATRI